MGEQLLRFLMGVGLGLVVVVAVALGTPASHAPSARAEAERPAPQAFLPQVERVTVEQALLLPDPLYIDVRRAERYRAHHIEGAISLPSSELKLHPETLPHDRPLVLYCTCPMEHASAMGASFLMEKGYKRVYALQSIESQWARLGQKDR